MTELEQSQRLLERVSAFAGAKVLLVGDLMLDRYLWGEVSRISPEAPVPVLKVTSEEARLGGAGSVVANLAALGAEVRTITALGEDAAGERTRALLDELGVDLTGLVTDAAVQTTQKTRLLARTQHVLRLDRDGVGLPDTVHAALAARAREALDGVGVVLISDYDRGVVSAGTGRPEDLVQVIAAEARRRGIPVLADPHRDAPFARYRGVSALTPNRSETQRAVGIVPTDEGTVLAAAQALVEQFELEWTTVTLDKDGIYLLEPGASRGRVFPAKARAVFDVAGAGDMVLAVLGLTLATGGSREEAVVLANVAGGLEVERLGVTPLAPEELVGEIRSSAPPLLRRKLATFDQAATRAEQAKRSGQTVVFTNGCFDLLHAGHVHFLQGCRAKGDFLVVGLNTDESISGLKGPDRPVLSLDERSTVLAGLEAVDMVVPFGEPTPIALIERVKPDVLCKGEDYANKVVVGRELVEGYGGRVELVQLRPGVSTTHVIERITGGS